MTDWTAIVEEALAGLGGREVCVPGAKLRLEVTRRGWTTEDDFGRYLAAEGKSFRQFLEENRRISVHPRPGTDMLVGFPGAAVPALRPAGSVVPAREAGRFRNDAYVAFTRISADPYVYVPASDRFTTDPGDATQAVELPAITLADLLEDRRAFANESMDEDNRVRLLHSLEFSSNPLASFHRSVIELGLWPRWNEFNLDRIRGRILAWAEEKGVEVSQAWFSQRRDVQVVEEPQRILSEVARYMTDEEIRALVIPFRAVEEMYRALPRKRES